MVNGRKLVSWQNLRDNCGLILCYTLTYSRKRTGQDVEHNAHSNSLFSFFLSFWARFDKGLCKMLTYIHRIIESSNLNLPSFNLKL